MTEKFFQKGRVWFCSDHEKLFQAWWNPRKSPPFLMGTILNVIISSNRKAYLKRKKKIMTNSTESYNSNKIVEVYDNDIITIQTVKQRNFRTAILTFLLAEASLVLICSSLGQTYQQIGQWCIDKHSSLSSLGRKKTVFLQV